MPLDALASLQSERRRLDEEELRLLAEARRAGLSWAAIAPALGVASRQAAEQRYLRLLSGDPRPARELRKQEASQGLSALREAVTHTRTCEELAAELDRFESRAASESRLAEAAA